MNKEDLSERLQVDSCKTLARCSLPEVCTFAKWHIVPADTAASNHVSSQVGLECSFDAPGFGNVFKQGP